MSWHWKQLLPVDSFSIRTLTQLTENDIQALTLLYQPLVGATAHSLYITMYQMLESDQYWSDEHAHRQLMTQMSLPLQTIYEERKKLEAIGLLKTFKKKDDKQSSYLYQLQPPMSPQRFLTDDVLSVYLLNRIGKKQFRLLRERFSVASFLKEEYEELTYSFDEVFTSLHHSEIVANLQSETAETLQVGNERQLLNQERESDLAFTENDFDFDLMKNDLSSLIVPEEALTDEVRSLIIRLAFIYQISPLEMSQIISKAMVQDNVIQLDELRKKCQDWYKIEHGNEPPSLGMKTQPLNQRVTKEKELKTEEEQTIHFYETTAPFILLEIRSDGAKPALADLKIIESLFIDHHLNPGVINVLVDYVLWQNDMKLSKAFIEKIGAHWARKKVKTVPEAMTLARMEQEKKKNTQNHSKRYSSHQPQIRQEQLPKWLIEEKQQKNKVGESQENKESQKQAASNAKERFEKMLKQYNRD
ncbi:DNA replication protein DnaB [Bacillus sp. TS-2]|nr:DNA replication protein DnaB [Bacillus sp. TS-2]